jgi:hypothetical protein
MEKMKHTKNIKKIVNDNFRSARSCWYAGDVIWTYEFSHRTARLTLLEECRGDSSACNTDDSAVGTLRYFISIIS